LTPLVIYVDVDDTFVRSYGTKRIPIPAVLGYVRSLFELGAALYCWSSGGADYAQASAEEFGIADCFLAFLPKPDVLLDDQHISDWRRLQQVHPNECDALIDRLRKEKDANL
jgi:hypothetical protein